MKKTFIILAILILSMVFAWFAFSREVSDGLEERYDAAVEAYYNKDYATAQKYFSEMVSQQPDNGFLYYNLGNVHYKMGQLGAAIQNYEKAALLIPRNGDLKTNLNQARSKLTDKIDESFSDYLFRTVYFWIFTLSLFEYQYFLAGLSVLFWGVVFFKYFRREKFLYTFFVMFALIYGYFVSGYALKYTTHRPGQFGVILKPEVDVKASYLEKDQPLFQLHEGTKIRVIDEQDFGEDRQWLKVKMPQGHSGWVPADVVGII